MLNPCPNIPTIYALPKMHKKTVPIPGRPIVSGNDSLIQGISSYVDEILASFVVSTLSYIRDTKDMVTQINGITVTKDTLLSRLDVESLYSNIQHHLGIKATMHFLYTKSIQFIEHKDFVVTLLEFS